MPLNGLVSRKAARYVVTARVLCTHSSEVVDCSGRGLTHPRELDSRGALEGHVAQSYFMHSNVAGAAIRAIQRVDCLPGGKRRTGSLGMTCMALHLDILEIQERSVVRC